MPHARSTRKREVGVFKILHCREPFLKKYVFGDRFHLIRVEDWPNHPEKNIRVQTNMDTCGQGLICRQTVISPPRQVRIAQCTVACIAWRF